MGVFVSYDRLGGSDGPIGRTYFSCDECGSGKVESMDRGWRGKTEVRAFYHQFII